MAKLALAAGTTSKTVKVTILDSSSTTGAGLTGLTSASSGLTAYYIREGDSAATQITLAAGTLGTWSSGGFVAVDGVNMPGLYELGLPNAALTGAKEVTVMLKGATNMVPCFLEIELTAWNNQDSVRGGLTALPNANAASAGGLITEGTGTGQLNTSGGRADANVVYWNGAAVVSPTTAGVPSVDLVTWLGGTPSTLLNGGVPLATTIRRGTCQAGSTSSTIVLDSSASSTNNFYVPSWIVLTGGTGAGQVAPIISYNGATKTATVYQAGPPVKGGQWVTTPDATTTFIIIPSGLRDAGVSVNSDGSVQADIRNINGTAIPTPGVAGVLPVDTFYWSSSAVNAAVSGNIPTQVAAYASGLDPATQVLVTPANKLATDVFGNAYIAGNVKKNAALNNFTFQMTDSTNHAPAPGLSVSGTKSLDGGSYTATTNAVTAIGNGMYKINLTAAEMNGNIVALRFTATGADDLNIILVTQP